MAKSSKRQSHQDDNITYENISTISGGSLSEIRPDQREGALRGAQLLSSALQAEGVDVLFGYPGGANLEIFDVLHEFGIKCIRTEHEQGAVHAAQGYARSTGRVGVCLATSGPGATNLVTGIADANSDSTAVVAITGNVPSHLLGKNAFQEVDIIGVTKPITKKNYLVSEVWDIPTVVREAFSLAAGNRPGPVLIDIPKDIQQHYPRDGDGNYTPPNIPAKIQPPESAAKGLNAHQLSEACRMIVEAARPIFYVGGGIVSANCDKLLLGLAEKLQIPVTNTIMGQGVFPPDHSLALHVLGMHGSKYANNAINEADLVIALGVRFDDRVTGKLDAFIEHGKIIHIDIDRKELNKNKVATLPICADVRIALEQLNENAVTGDTSGWIEHVTALRRTFPFSVPQRDTITPQYTIDLISELTAGEAIVSLGVGQHQMWAMQFYRSSRSHSFLSSSGFGTMGYGLPAAIGAKIGNPDRQVIDIDGDGSLNMTIHELATCYRFNIGVKIVVINNQWLGMVRQWQDMIYDQHRAATDLSDPQAVGRTDEQRVYPDFIKISEGYGIRAERVIEKADLKAAIVRLLNDPNEAFLLDVIVEREENVYPMIPAGASYTDIIMNAEDMGITKTGKQGSNI